MFLLMPDSEAPIYSIADSQNVLLSLDPGKLAHLAFFSLAPALISQDFRYVQELQWPVWARGIVSVLESWWKNAPVSLLC